MADSRTRDFLIGLFVLASIGVLVAAFIRTSRVVGDRYDLYMRADVAQGLTRDTRVYLQGLEIGRVRQMNPVVDTSSSELRFVALLEIDERFPDGTPLTLPFGTEAVIAQPSPIAEPTIQIVMPRGQLYRLKLQPGDTIESRRRPEVLDALADAATVLSEELMDRLSDSRELLELSGETISSVNTAVEGVSRAITRIVPRMDTLITLANANLTASEEMLTELGPRVGPLADSLALTLRESRRALAHLDSLVVDGHHLLSDNREAIDEIIERMRQTAVTLNHFSDQISRRPMRLFFGVTPPESDSSEEDR